MWVLSVQLALNEHRKSALGQKTEQTTRQRHIKMGGKNPCKAINGNNIAKRKFYFLNNYNVLHCDIIYEGYCC